MRLKRYLVTFTFLAIAPHLSFADIKIFNHTNTFGTGKIGISPCSSIAGEGGIAKPHSAINLPQSFINTYCMFNCNAELFVSKNCSGKSIATLKIEPKKGVMNITNHHIRNFVVTGHGKAVAIEGDQAKSWLETLYDLI